MILLRRRIGAPRTQQNLGMFARVVATCITANRVRGTVAAIAMVVPFGVSSMAQADDPVKLVLILKNHLFQPAEIKVPTGKPVEITIRNEDATPEEFESNSLKLEKIVAGRSEGIVRIRSLKAGRYEFIGEYNKSTAMGVLVAE